MKLTDKFEIKNYKDYQKHKQEIFNILSDTLDLIIEEAAQKNPTFLINDYDKMVSINDL